jgi:predicted nucleotidyltransferase
MKTDSFMAVLKALHEHEVEYILIGGLAVILHGVPRLTEDLDIFVKKDESNLTKLKKALRSVFKDESIEEMTRNDLVDYPVVRYGTPENYYIDIMDRVGEGFTYDDCIRDYRKSWISHQSGHHWNTDQVKTRNDSPN